MRPLEQMPKSSDEQQAENSAMHGEPGAEKMPTSARTLGDQFGIHRHPPAIYTRRSASKGFISVAEPGICCRSFPTESGRETN
jgi:hypothetical protein